MSLENSVDGGQPTGTQSDAQELFLTPNEKCQRGNAARDEYEKNQTADASDFSPDFLAERARVPNGIFGRVRVVESGCWEWQGATNSKGYGCLGLHGVKLLAHRAVYEVFNGAIPENLQVTHRCDNRKCVNPQHLSSGTNQDNMKDASQKGRLFFNRPQDRQCYSRLTVEQVLEIRAMRAAGSSHTDIAAKYGIAASNSKSICSGRTWAHVPLTQKEASPRANSDI